MVKKSSKKGLRKIRVENEDKLHDISVAERRKGTLNKAADSQLFVIETDTTSTQKTVPISTLSTALTTPTAKHTLQENQKKASERVIVQAFLSNKKAKEIQEKKAKKVSKEERKRAKLPGLLWSDDTKPKHRPPTVANLLKSRVPHPGQSINPEPHSHMRAMNIVSNWVEKAKAYRKSVNEQLSYPASLDNVLGDDVIDGMAVDMQPDEVRTGPVVEKLPNAHVIPKIKRKRQAHNQMLLAHARKRAHKAFHKEIDRVCDEIILKKNKLAQLRTRKDKIISVEDPDALNDTQNISVSGNAPLVPKAAIVPTKTTTTRKPQLQTKPASKAPKRTVGVNLTKPASVALKKSKMTKQAKEARIAQFSTIQDGDDVLLPSELQPTLLKSKTGSAWDLLGNQYKKMQKMGMARKLKGDAARKSYEKLIGI